MAMEFHTPLYDENRERALGEQFGLPERHPAVGL